MTKQISCGFLVLVFIVINTNKCTGDDRVEFVPHQEETLSPEDLLAQLFSEPSTSRRTRETVNPIPPHAYDSDDEESARVFPPTRVPKLVQMLSSFDLSAVASSNADALLRGGFDPHSTLTDTEPLWDRSLKRIEDFVAVTRELKQLSAEIKTLFDGNIQIMDAMTKDTNTNFIGFYN
ncbi:hypothetical protein RP20_CCG001618 [Aedes albopictus]|nr:hypothetical protein RP20_CCG001618 [Aedes albopictus]